ncbi:MAG: MlaE family lipid ABC transporter permease subunit [Nitrospiraceae bacterium]|nr:MlaE family lipid ABC transporter permease subunit [Nitrospiraceae bacterium]
MTSTADIQPAVSSLVTISSEGTLTLSIAGHLDVSTTGSLWRQAMQMLEQERPARLVIDASGISYCDGAGVALLLQLRKCQEKAGGEVEIHDLPEAVQYLLDLYGSASAEDAAPGASEPISFVEQVGRASGRVWKDLYTLVAFLGELSVALLYAARHPRSVRWKDAAMTAELAGVNALPIIALIGFLLGLIMAFQSAIPMRQFGAEIFIANLIGLSMIRELGPLLTAIILAGRSGSAFAAELGTMKVNEEIDALTTMGLEPVRFLAVPRVIAAVAMTPLLSVFTSLFGLIGGAVVMRSLGFPLVTYVDRIQSSVHPGDLLQGLFKAVAFGIVVAGIGCLRGLQTKTGASAVGDSTTNAVVSGLILIAVVDGLFAVVFYYLGV